MATDSEKVMQMVEKELRRNPDIANAELYEKAQGVDESVGELTLRQFHAKYPLQVKRRMAPKTSGKKPRRRSRRTRASRKGEVDREAVRRSLIRFAKDVSAAEGKAATIELLADMDRYVDELVEALDGGRS